METADGLPLAIDTGSTLLAGYLLGVSLRAPMCLFLCFFWCITFSDSIHSLSSSEQVEAKHPKGSFGPSGQHRGVGVLDFVKKR